MNAGEIQQSCRRVGVWDAMQDSLTNPRYDRVGKPCHTNGRYVGLELDGMSRAFEYTDSFTNTKIKLSA